MKMNRKANLALLALFLCFAMVMPMLVSCSTGGLELPEEETVTLTAEEIRTMQNPVVETETAEETVTEEYDPMKDYIPPENYIDYSDNENLNSTQNVGGSGSMAVVGGNNEVSWFAYSQYAKENDKVLFSAAARRDGAEKAMRDMLTVRWTPAKNTVYSYNPLAYSKLTTVNEAEFAKNRINLESGKVYQGLPYSLGSAGLAAFVDGFTAQNGVYTIPLTQRMLSGNQNCARLGVDAADALFWGWASVSPSVRFTDTATMVEAKGVRPVGDYKLPASLADATDDVVAAAGAETIYAAYAKMQKADGLVADTEAKDHAMMAVSVTVVNGADGKIDPKESFVTVLEQTDKNLAAYEALSAAEKEAKKNEVLVIGGIDVKYTFEELMNDGFLPITCKELVEDGALDAVFVGDSIRTGKFTKATIYAGGVRTNRRIAVAHLKIFDANGNALLDTRSYPQESGIADTVFSVNLANWNVASEIGRCRGDCDPAAVLTVGEEYRYVLTGILSTGETVTLREYSFTY